MATIVTNILAVILGGAITFFCSKYYFEKASHELRKEAGDLRDLINVMLCAMEALGWIELKMDEEGKVSGFYSLIPLKDGTILKFLT